MRVNNLMLENAKKWAQLKRKIPRKRKKENRKTKTAVGTYIW